MVLSFSILAGFLALAAADYSAIRKNPLLSGIFGAFGYLAIVSALAEMAFGPIWGAPAAASAANIQSGIVATVGVILAIGAGLLLVWSVFLELPRERRRLGLRPGQVVTSGGYALCRHPGWWCLTFLTAGICLARGSGRVFVSSIVMTAANLLLITVQDRYFFPQLFAGYDDYKKSTPFLLPSVRRRK